MIEFCESEYLNSTLEDGDLIAILSFYESLSAMEAIAIKDRYLYDRNLGSDSPDIGVRSNLELGAGHSTSDTQDQGQSA